MVKSVDNPKYIYIETRKDSKKQIALTNRFAFLKKIYMRYQYHKLPITYEALDLLNVSGKKIILPFSLEELGEFRKEKITDMLNRIILGEETQNIVVEKSLDTYVDPSLFIDGRMIPYLYLDEIIRLVRKVHKIPEKDMRLKIIDSNSIDLEEILVPIIDNLNYLTIITEREEKIEALAEKIYEETGLLIVVKNKKILNEPIDADLQPKPAKDVILDLSEENIKNIYCLEKDSIYVDLSSNKEKVKMILAKRKDIAYYNYFEFMVANQKINNRILQAILCGNATWISKGDMKGLALDVKKFPIQLKKAGISLDF